MTAAQSKLQLTRWLLWLSAIVWLAFGVISLIRLSSNGLTPNSTRLVIVFLLLGNAAGFAISGWGLGKHRLAYPFALAIILANILLTFTDQFGLFDFLTLLLDGLILFLLWRLRPVGKQAT